MKQLKKYILNSVIILTAGMTFYACSSDKDELFDKISTTQETTTVSNITGTILTPKTDYPDSKTHKMPTKAFLIGADADVPGILSSSRFTAHCLIKVAGDDGIKHTEVTMSAKSSSDGKYTIIVQDAGKVFHNAVKRNPYANEEWEMAIIAGGGKWDESSKRVIFAIEGNDGVSSHEVNHLIAPLTTNWTKVTTNGDGSYNVKLIFSIRGTLVRLNVNNERTEAFRGAVRLNSKALCRNIYFDMSSPSHNGQLVWKPLAKYDKPTIVTNSAVPARYAKQFIFWGMPTNEQTEAENEFTPDQYGYTFINETNDELYRRKGDFKEGKSTNLSLRIANIKLPIEYFDKNNYTRHSKWAFTNTSYNNQSYYVYNRALDILTDLDKQNKDWHVPSVFEWAAIVPRSHGYTEEAASRPLIYLDGKSNHRKRMEQNEEVESPRNNFTTYRSEYINIRKGVNYAVRFAPPTAKVRWRSAASYNASFHSKPIPFAKDYRYYSAYKYEVVEDAGNGQRGLLVTVRYLGEGGKHITLKDINDEFWNNPAPSGINDVKISFPFYGYMDQGIINKKVKQQGEACYYWTVTPGGSLVPLGGWMTYITAARSISLRDYQLNETHDGRQYRYLLRLVSSK
ncbi:hypothetical protein [Prevotella sp. HUN102]|uniref:hypothetical protein n=1 Tax=Prevotella sp. HUN102 TaxID=1392486 RepID=UPI00048A951F|nr:hypothetical protein [Prevotella sp. HUN102]